MARKHIETCANTLARAVRAVARTADRLRFATVSSAICVFGAQLVEAQHSFSNAQESAFPTPATLSAGAQERCAEAAVDLAAASSERSVVCAAASRALERLGRCDIFLQRPLRIQILDEVRHPRHGRLIFGFFDTAQEVVLVTKRSSTPGLVENTPYSQLRPLEFYKSLIVHEVVHGVMHQNLKEIPTSKASYEYPAYAIQLESLPSDERNKLLQEKNRNSKSDKFRFNDLILSFDPFFFAARAYQHFKSSPNSCARLHALLDGEVPFIGTSPLP